MLVRAGAEREHDETFARRLGLAAVHAAEHGPRFLLAHCDGHLEIRWNASAGPNPLHLDFTSGSFGDRSRSRRQPLARAVGLAAGALSVLDATAGLGRDAFTLASLRCAVTAVERSPVLAALLADGVRRGGFGEDRLAVVCADARDVMLGLGEDERPDVIVLDPMLPHSDSSAKVKKETQLLRELIGPATESDVVELLELARRTAGRRTVVKRPLRAKPLAPDCDAQVAGNRVRWDVYLRQP